MFSHTRRPITLTALAAFAALPALISIGCSDDGASGGGGGTSGDPAIRVVARVEDDVDGPWFEWSGSAVIARFTGDSVSVQLDEAWGTNYYEVIVDGLAQPVLETAGGTATYLLASGLDDSIHEVRIHRRTEAFFGPTQLLGLSFGVGGELLAPPAAPARRIEIIGDSISTGYGVDAADQYASFSGDTENHYLTYGAVAARALGADLVTTAWSGIGVYRNGDGSLVDTMPERWEFTLPTDDTTPHDFTQYVPHVVVINLCTNDFAGGVPPQAPFELAYTTFVQRIREVYPDAHILCTLGPMLSGTDLTTARGYIQDVVAAVGATDDRIHFLEFATQDAANGYGSDWHPSAATHALMANTLEQELHTLLGW